MLRSIQQLVAPSIVRNVRICSARQSSGLCFDLSDDQKAVQDVSRKYAREVIINQAAELDRTGEFPWKLLRELHELGMINPTIPAAYGGLGLSILDEAIMSDELSYGCAGVNATRFACTLAGSWSYGPCLTGDPVSLYTESTPLVQKGSPFIQDKYLKPMTERLVIASYAVTEPGAGSDVAAVRTRAVRKGDKWVINGQKMWITNAGHAEWFVVLTRTTDDPKCPTSKAFTAFIVDAHSPGVTVGRKEINMGQRCGDTHAITFEDVEVPHENMLGEEGKGFLVCMGTFDATRPPIGAMAVGSMQRALEESTKYSMERKTFGVPIAQHQAVSMMIAEMAMHVELSRLVVYKAAYEHTQGRRNTYHSAISKAFSADTNMKAAIDCVQVFGGNGFNTEYPAEKLMRDAKILQIYEGTSQIQRLVIFKEWVGIMTKMGL